MQAVFKRENLLHFHSMDRQQTHFTNATASKWLEQFPVQEIKGKRYSPTEYSPKLV